MENKVMRGPSTSACSGETKTMSKIEMNGGRRINSTGKILLCVFGFREEDGTKGICADV